MPFQRLRTFFVAALFACIASVSSAADIRVEDQGVVLDGLIKRGDYFRLRLELAKEVNVYRILGGVTLNSPGGDMAEAMKIGELVRLLRLRTTVADDGICASACFFVWLGGAARSGGYDGSLRFGKVGLHRPYQQSASNSTHGVQRQLDISESQFRN